MNCITALKPAFYHGDNESGWTIMYENSFSIDRLVQGVLIFDTEEEVKQAFEEGGEYVELEH